MNEKRESLDKREVEKVVKPYVINEGKFVVMNTLTALHDYFKYQLSDECNKKIFEVINLIEQELYVGQKEMLKDWDFDWEENQLVHIVGINKYK